MLSAMTTVREMEVRVNLQKGAVFRSNPLTFDALTRKQFEELYGASLDAEVVFVWATVVHCSWPQQGFKLLSLQGDSFCLEGSKLKLCAKSARRFLDLPKEQSEIYYTLAINKTVNS